MCKVEDEVKFCTCPETSAVRSTQHWIFYRHDPSRSNMVIGRVATPARLSPSIDRHNKQTLLACINKPGTFDVDLDPRPGDRLAVTLQCSPQHIEPSPKRSDVITYGYEWRHGAWVEAPFNPLEWQWHHVRQLFGTLESSGRVVHPS